MDAIKQLQKEPAAAQPAPFPAARRRGGNVGDRALPAAAGA
ncbi:MAG TPA: hypothetical protein VNZ67_15485 [bacterium]|jgi:hypothetical protein|nr:hypothetical protein [bacterium]